MLQKKKILPRNILAILLSLALLCAHALAFEGKNYPSYDGASLPANAAGGGFGGENLLLEFDAAPEFSMAENGVLQLCFFAFDASEENYLELFLMLPQNIASGDTFSGDTLADPGCSVSLYEVTPAGETLYYAGQLLGVPYPEGGSFEIQISAAETGASGLALRGALNAQLVRFEGDFATGETLSLSGVEFDCTLPLTSSSSDSGDPFAPAPAFTLPPDYAVI